MELREVSHATAKQAVHDWHYTGRCPQASAKFGVYEHDRFVGVVLFGVGAASAIGRPFGVKQCEIMELLRVALDVHDTPTSRIVAVSLRLLKRQFPSLRVVISFADTVVGHIGTLYQACGWMYVGGKSYHAYRVLGEVVHPKTLHSRYGIGGQSVPWLREHIDPVAERIHTPVKHKYVWFYDQALKEQWQDKALPYPRASLV